MKLKAIKCNNCGAVKLFQTYFLYEHILEELAAKHWQTITEQEHYRPECPKTE